MPQIEIDESALRGKRFHLKCKVALLRFSYRDSYDQRLHESQPMILVPLPNDETNRFLNAFMKGDAVELVVDVLSPVNERGRVSLQSPNQHCKAYYMFVMSEALKARMNLMVGAEVDVETLPIDDPAQEESF